MREFQTIGHIRKLLNACSLYIILKYADLIYITSGVLIMTMGLTPPVHAYQWDPNVPRRQCSIYRQCGYMVATCWLIRTIHNTVWLHGVYGPSGYMEVTSE